MSDRDQHVESAVAEAAEVFDRLPDAVTDLFGDEATAESAYDLLTVDVPAAAWLTALRTARDELGCTYFDWLSAVDEPGVGFRVCAHVAALGTGTVRRLMVRTTVPHDAAVLPSAIDVYAGAAWHERETHEMFGVAFEGHPHLVPLLLPEGFEGHPLRKDFVLAARVAKAWPGAKEPGEPAEGHTGPKRRAMLPPGVPDPNEWGPLKGQLPPAAARPARAARTAADRPPRRTRTASEGSAAQRPTPPPGTEAPEAPGREVPGAAGAAAPEAPAVQTPAPAPESSGAAAPTTPEASVIPGAAGETPTSASPVTPEALGTPEAPGTPETLEALGTPEAPGTRETPGTPAAARPRRSRSASEGSASQRPEPDVPGTTPARPARRSRSASDGSASQRPEPGDRPAPPPAGPRRSRSASEGSAGRRQASDAPEGSPSRPPRVRSTDAPWHDAQPAFDEPEGPETESPDEPSQPLRRSRSGGTRAEPPVREGAGRGVAPRSGPTPTEAAPAEAAPAEATDSEAEPAPDPDKPTPEHPTPDHPAGGDPE
ncbi:NADH-quinone oxidoreductase subunit C [Streptomyces sp. TRM75563]|uniref:NADH-quinone oxidoreductase subunit C n=1 Tax=Streptomyces sp. TRM75563 TaxID=2817418 RepID=UPI001F61D4A2|nr:NADH-quinone oxidoreductase subunit C [Streptomyces sp. TRM75563]MCI4044620.1 NADH-quinone oxidoreductase subunit C [Streptomyces sp. TRM75563]